MGLGRELRRYAAAALAPFFCVVAIAYFGFHYVQGERGLIAYLRLSEQVASAEQRLSAVRVERQQIEHRVNLLRPERLDRDLLEERARAILGYAHKNEIVLFDRAGSR
jgi:cell division protein FtsB